MIEQLSTTTSSSAGETLSFVYERHSTRSFTATPLSDGTIQTLLEAAVHAPSAMHVEPWRFVVIQNREVLERISTAAKRLASADAAKHGRLLRPPGASGDGIASPLANREFDIFYHARTVVVICTENAGEFASADCWLAAENLMLAAAALGLGSCCVGFAIAALNTAVVQSELGIPVGSRAVAAIALGERDGPAVATPRRAPVVWKWIRG